MRGQLSGPNFGNAVGITSPCFLTRSYWVKSSGNSRYDSMSILVILYSMFLSYKADAVVMVPGSRKISVGKGKVEAECG